MNTNSKPAAKKTAAKSSAAGSKSGSKSASSSKGGAKAQAEIKPRSMQREIWGVVCLFAGLFTFIGFFKVDALFITYFCASLKGFIGYGYYLLPPALIACAIILFTHKGRPVQARSICLVCIPAAFGALCHCIFSKFAPAEKFIDTFKDIFNTGKEMTSGGLISGGIGQVFEDLFSVYGAVPVFIFSIIALFMAAFRITPAMVFEKMRERDADFNDDEFIEDAPAAEKAKKKKKEAAAAQIETFTAPAAEEPKPLSPAEAKRRAAMIDIPMDEEEENPEDKSGFFRKKPRVQTPAGVLTTARTVDDILADAGTPAEEKSPTANVEPMSIEEAAKIAGVDPVMIQTQSVESAPAQKPAAPAKPLGKKEAGELEIKRESDAVAKAVEEGSARDYGEYHYPPSSLLKSSTEHAVDASHEMQLNSERLQTTLHSFGVGGVITDITRGPTVTRYDVELDPGVKLSKITNLAGDLALALGVTGVRIAPIPDMVSTVGIEVPNKIVSTVYLRDIIESPAFRDAGSKLTFAIGEDIGGSKICGNIAKLPHLLIAGTTGSGKSVCMNSLILSLLFKASPEELRFIMIDPKMVELGIYNGIPHLYIPVVTDPKKAAGSLQWAVVEMLKRYRLFSEVGARDLSGYNAIQKRSGEATLPQVVIVIDELADLMMVAGKEVESSICRIAQMGRASGMHLVIATQRPSADVITGLMKSNIPSRIAFAVASAMESRIILDNSGAEKLIGSGDMLYAPLGIGKPKRVQGAFVSDEEREEIVNFVKSYSEADYSEEIMAAVEQAAVEKDASSDKGKGSDASAAEGGLGQYDELLPQAVDVVLEPGMKQASVTMLQRRLKLGYARAARIVDQMEELGVLGPFEGSKPRQVLITREQWREMQLINGVAPTDTVQMDMFAEDSDEAEDAPWDDEE